MYRTENSGLAPNIRGFWRKVCDGENYTILHGWFATMTPIEISFSISICTVVDNGKCSTRPNSMNDPESENSAGFFTSHIAKGRMAFVVIASFKIN